MPRRRLHGDNVDLCENSYGRAGSTAGERRRERDERHDIAPDELSEQGLGRRVVLGQEDPRYHSEIHGAGERETVARIAQRRIEAHGLRIASAILERIQQVVYPYAQTARRILGHRDAIGLGAVVAEGSVRGAGGEHGRRRGDTEHGRRLRRVRECGEHRLELALGRVSAVAELGVGDSGEDMACRVGDIDGTHIPSEARDVKTISGSRIAWIEDDAVGRDEVHAREKGDPSISGKSRWESPMEISWKAGVTNVVS